MKALFVHDHYFTEINGQFYSSGGLPSAVWQRYLSVFDEIMVVGRSHRDGLVDTERLTISSRDRVTFTLMPSLSNLRSIVSTDKVFKHKVRDILQSCDVLIARVPSRLGHYFVNAAKKNDIPYLLEIVACPWDSYWYYGGLKGKLFAPLAAMELRKQAYESSFNLYVTEYFLQNRYPGSRTTHSVACSNVHIPYVDHSALSARVSKINHMSPPYKIGLIGSYFNNNKGIDVAIKSLGCIKDIIPDFYFEVVGDGNSEAYFKIAEKCGISDKVNFVGRLPSGNEIYKWLDSIDLYLQPSYQEGLPRALIEALSRGCPALATKVAGIPELLKTDRLVRAGDYKGLAKKIVEILVDKNELKKSAGESFGTSKRYESSILSNKRQVFLEIFKDHVQISEP